MKILKSIFTKTDTQTALWAIPENLRFLYVNTQALKGLVAEFEEAALLKLSQAYTPTDNPFDFENHRPVVTGVLDHQSIWHLVSGRCLLAAAENSPQYQQAKALCEPALAAHSEHLAREEKKVREHALATQKLEEARRAAEAKARAIAEKDPDVLAAAAAHAEAVARLEAE